jgi:hypothetical protein
MGDANNLVPFGELLELLGDTLRGPASNAGINFIKNERLKPLRFFSKRA